MFIALLDVMTCTLKQQVTGLPRKEFILEFKCLYSKVSKKIKLKFVVIFVTRNV